MLEKEQKLLTKQNKTFNLKGFLKLSISSIILSSTVYATNLIQSADFTKYPLSKELTAKSRGGNLPDKIAATDGIGSTILIPVGKNTDKLKNDAYNKIIYSNIKKLEDNETINDLITNGEITVDENTLNKINNNVTTDNNSNLFKYTIYFGIYQIEYENRKRDEYPNDGRGITTGILYDNNGNIVPEDKFTSTLILTENDPVKTDYDTIDNLKNLFNNNHENIKWGTYLRGNMKYEIISEVPIECVKLSGVQDNDTRYDYGITSFIFFHDGIEDIKPSGEINCGVFERVDE